MWTVAKVCSKEILDVYVASCTETGGIYHYKLCEKKLQLADVTPMDRPMYMVMEDRKMYVILRAPYENGESGVVVYDIDDAGKLVNPSPMQSTKGTVACHILAEGENVYCANYISGSVIKLPGQVVQHTGSGPHPTRQEGPHMHFVGLTPDGKYICAADLGTDTVYLYDRDLELRGSAKVPAGHGVRHIAFSQDGKWMFTANELKSTVSAFAYENGTLELVDTCSAVPDDFTGETAAAAIRVKDGDIYVSHRGHDSVARLSFDGSRLTLQDTVPCGGKTPRDFCFVGNDILCANQDSDSVTLLDGSSGYAIADTVNVKMPICVCVGRDLEITQYDGPGYRALIDCNGWRVAIANYAPALELERLDFLERHLETDEVFALIEGTAGLLIGKDRRKVMLEKGKLYNVKRGVWHRLFMTGGAKVLIVENTDTGRHNTEYLKF